MAASTATRPSPASSNDAVNVRSIIAFVLSALGITSPIGIWLGYSSREEIDQRGGIGREFSIAAIIIGWLWIVCIVLGLIAFLWILI